MGGTILVVGEDRHFARLVRQWLGESGFNVEVAVDEEVDLDQVVALRPDLVVIDPGRLSNGRQICQQLREVSEVPLIVVSSGSGEEDRIASLEAGADDFLTKPLNPQELVARVKAILRRTQVLARPVGILRVGELQVDTGQREARIGDRVLNLRPKEYGILEILASRPDRVVSREHLLRAVWGLEHAGDDRTLSVHITWLRAKLAGSHIRLQAVRGFGYKLTASREPHTDEASADNLPGHPIIASAAKPART